MTTRARLGGWMLVVLATGATACAMTPEEQVLVACTTLCHCTETLPALQDRCVARCEPEFDAARVSDACVACIADHADRCSTLERDCEPICESPTPVEFQ